MNLSNLKDQEVLTQIKTLVQSERELLTSILHHLREIESRRLFSDLKYSSLFDYAVHELKYSESQAVRRISAMRLLKELPQVEQKIQSGILNLSNLCQAQTYFRSADRKAKTENAATLSTQNKIDVLQQLENKSAREGEKLLISLQPEIALPSEKERILTQNHSEVRFIMDNELRKNLEQVRSLLGIKGLKMSFSELANEMAVMSIQALRQKAFGKKRAEETKDSMSAVISAPTYPSVQKVIRTSPSTSKVNASDATYISKALKFKIWQRDGGQCTVCSGTRNLNYDHIQPKALGGENSFQNLRLLCFHCNQRRAAKTFGTTYGVITI